jgi:hypothetical protein
MVGHGTLFTVTPDKSTSKIDLGTECIEVLQETYKKCRISRTVGPPIIQENKCLNLTSLAMNVL